MTAIVALGLRILLAGSLYILLGWILVVLWQEIRQQGTFQVSQKRTSIHIDAKLENGNDRKFHFWQTEIIIGRNSQCDISLKDEPLSTIHARISFHHTQWWLEDLESTNGTFLNKTRVTVPTVIISDDQFTCGNTVFTIHMDDAEDKFPHEITT